MRSAPWFCAIVALTALILPRLEAQEGKQDAKKDDDAKGKVEGKKDDDAKGKKDEEAKGKIPAELRKKIQDNKVTFGVVLIEVTAGGPATNGREQPKDKGDIVSLEEGDIITHVDGKEIKTAADYHKLMSGKDEKKLTVIDINTGKSVTDYFKPVDGKLGIVFEVISMVG